MLKTLSISGILGILLIFSFSSRVCGQGLFELQYSIQNEPKTLKKEKFEQYFSDSLQREKEITKIIINLQLNGFVEANIDSFSYNGNNKHVYIDAGQQYEWKELKKGNIDWEALDNIHYTARDFDQQEFSYLELKSLYKEIIQSFENSGYPFACIYLDDIEIKERKIKATLMIDKGNLIHVDTIIIKGYKDIRQGFIEQYLNIQAGDLYNESLIAEIDKQLNKLNFAKASQGSEILFGKNLASIVLYLEENSSNTFDGILGFQPNSGNSEQLQVTGNIRLDLNNALQHGEKLRMNWESPGNQSQLLELYIRYPYLLNSPFGISYGFDLDKRDSSYINIENEPALHFSLQGQDYLGAYGYFLSSNTLGSPEEINPDNGIIDMHIRSFGLELLVNDLDYNFNPRKGFFVNIKGDAGYKYYDQRNDVSPETYDSIPERNFRLSATGQISYYIPLFKQQTVLFENKTGLINSSNLMINELFRIGGFNSLRGFDEQSITASFYSIFSVEYRFLLDRNSFLGAFWDIAPVHSPYQEVQEQIHQGFGLAFSFSSQAGIFKLAYAVGKTQDESIQFKNAKIHFGYSALF